MRNPDVVAAGSVGALIIAGSNALNVADHLDSAITVRATCIAPQNAFSKDSQYLHH